jgi:hypothetical protein
MAAHQALVAVGSGYVGKENKVTVVKKYFDRIEATLPFAGI